MFNVQILHEIYLSVFFMGITTSSNIRFRASLGLQVFLVFLHTFVEVYLYFCFDLRKHTMLCENDTSLKIRNISFLSSLITSVISQVFLWALYADYADPKWLSTGEGNMYFWDLSYQPFCLNLNLLARQLEENWKLFF